MKITVKYETKGPILQGQGGPVIDGALREALDLVSAEGLRRLHTYEHAHFKHPTGYYEAHTVRTMRSDGYDITDSRVIYGPWLEGISRRNQRSRFKGYWSFRTIGQQLDRDAQAIAAPALDRMTRGLNGN